MKNVLDGYRRLSIPQIKEIQEQFSKNNNKEATITVDGQKIKVTLDDLYISRKELEEFEKKLKEKTKEKTND